MHPGDSRGDCHAEHLGENNGRDFAGKLLLGCAARSSSIDPERAETLTEIRGGDRSPRKVAREEPAVRDGADADVSGAACGHVGGEERAEPTRDG